MSAAKAVHKTLQGNLERSQVLYKSHTEYWTKTVLFSASDLCLQKEIGSI